MTDSDPQLIRHATIDDLDALAAMESECFPAAEAADRSSLRARIETLLLANLVISFTARPCAPESRPIRNVSGY